jgi:SNF2 family DNA or RNA helicase
LADNCGLGKTASVFSKILFRSRVFKANPQVTEYRPTLILTQVYLLTTWINEYKKRFRGTNIIFKLYYGAKQQISNLIIKDILIKSRGLDKYLVGLDRIDFKIA